MDGKRFDAVSKLLVRGLTRQKAFKSLGAGGAAAGLSMAVGAGRSRQVHSQTQAAPCQLTLVLNVRVGPSTLASFVPGSPEGELRGELVFAPGPDGSVEGGVLRLDTGDELPVTGQVWGRHISLRAKGGLGEVIVLIGSAEQPHDRCSGAVDGTLTGPEIGDLGEWHAVATGGGAVPPSADAPQGQASAQPTETALSTEAAEPTAAAPTVPAKPTAPAAEGLTANVVVIAPDANFQAEPSSASESLAVLAEGTELTTLGETVPAEDGGIWVKVADPETGDEGWILEDLIEPL